MKVLCEMLTGCRFIDEALKLVERMVFMPSQAREAQAHGKPVLNGKKVEWNMGAA